MQSAGTDDLLQFRDYNSTPSTSSPPAQINVNSPTHSGGSGSGNNALNELIYDMSNSAGILSGSNAAGDGGNINTSATTAGSGADGGGAGAGNKVSFLTFEYYQQFFNVDTSVVLERIVNAVVPMRASKNYLRFDIGENPDLYGPFWITVTLIFSIAIGGNIASYLQHADDNYQWRYNFHLVSYAATSIFIYANFVPILFWALFKYTLKPVTDEEPVESANYTPSLLSLMCLYGYSLFVYIPFSVLWLIQISIVQWVFVIISFCLSGLSMMHVLTPATRNSKISQLLIFGILLSQSLLAVCFMFYFFHMPNSPVSTATESAAIEEVIKTAKLVVTPPVVAGNIAPANGTR